MRARSVLAFAVWLTLLLTGCQQTTTPTAVPPTATMLPTRIAADTAVAATIPTVTPSPAPSITPSPTHLLTPASSPPSPTHSITPSPPHLLAPSPSASPTPSLTPSPTVRPYATIDATAHPPGTAVPSPAPLFAKPDHITNIILLGNDVSAPQGGRTDSLILVSIDRENKTATMLSLPRDLYVVIPGWRMTRINLALPHGHGTDYPGAGGGLIKDTIEYNLGIPVDYYARIGFDGFKTAVDTVGGIEMVVNCPLTDWRLIAPDLDPELEESWELFTLEVGVQPMDGDLALWYARSRRTTNDFERGLRQQRILQAIFNKGLALDMLPQLPNLWTAYKQHVETDIPLTVMLELATLAPAVQANGIQHMTLPYAALKSWRDPAGGSVQLLQWAEAEPTLRRVMEPPALNRAVRPSLTVEVVTADYILYRQMADNLAWYGFVPQYTAATETPARTTIEQFVPNLKGADAELLSWLFHRQPADITLSSEAGEATYRVTLGYDANPCLSFLQPPVP
ncbi:MAG TPA: LCP family protein [Chloroflexota bacterium]|nr:LCP family protein [Chloroflexota bacterium]